MAAVLERDAGFCSGEDEEDLDADLHSPTDVSEDSVDVKVKPIASLLGGCRNKRKCAEPRKMGEEIKRRLVEYKTLEPACSPFRPWSQHNTPTCYVSRGFHVSVPDQEEPLSLVLKDKSSSDGVIDRLQPLVSVAANSKSRPRPQDVVRIREIPLKHSDNPNKIGSLNRSSLEGLNEVEEMGVKPRSFSVESLIGDRPGTSSTPSTSSAGDKRKTQSVQSQQRNYKNMTRERRIEANARERTRVHTISAAFDTLRRTVPAYSHNQKLSKLSVLRIACSYILTLSRIAGSDYSADNSLPSLADCVDNVSKTIQMEGKLRKKKDD